MTNNLKLITTESFGDLPCNFYRNMNDDILLTRDQIGTALEYVYPTDGISKIHRKHQDRLDGLSVVAKLASTDGKEYNTTLYCQRGIMELCRWSNKPKANIFMDWVWDIVEKYRNNELIAYPSVDIAPIMESISNITNTLSVITDRLTNLEQYQSNQYLQKNKYPSAWYKRMKPKYTMLVEYFGCDISTLYSNIYKELEDTYNVDVDELWNEYCYENHVSKEDTYRMDAIEHHKQLKEATTLLVNSMLIKYGLQTEDEIKHFKRKTIFDMTPDEVAAKRAN